MPEYRTELVADLRLEVSDASGSTTAHLHNSAAGLVLDVADPGVLVRSLPTRDAVRRLPLDQAADLLGGASVLVRSGERDLVRVRFTDDAKLRLRPRPAGVLVAARIYLSARKIPSWWPAAVAAAVAVLVVRSRARRG